MQIGVAKANTNHIKVVAKMAYVKILMTVYVVAVEHAMGRGLFVCHNRRNEDVFVLLPTIATVGPLRRKLNA